MKTQEKNSIAVISYEKYRLQWMLNHGYTLTDLIHQLDIMQCECPDSCIETLFDDWDYGYGFGGEIWASFGEFLQAEFLDCSYMKRLLTTDEYSSYIEYTNKK